MSTSRRRFNFELFRKNSARDEMREEIEFHLDARIEQLVARGMSPDAARAEAIRRLGSSLADAQQQLGKSAERKTRRIDMKERLHDLIDDVRYALRGLARKPGFTTVAVLTLAIGIGANTSIYSAVDALLLRSLPYQMPDRLIDIVQDSPEDGEAQWSYLKFQAFRDASQSYASLALYQSALRNLTDVEPERLRVEEVSGTYLKTLGVPLAIGADFPREIDAGAGSRKLVILSDALWQRRFNADPEIVGKSLQLENEPWEILGVLRPDFRGLSGNADALVNLTARTAEGLNEAWSLEFSMIGRLKPGVSPEQAGSEANLLGPRIYAMFPQEGTLTTSKAPSAWTASARPLNTIRVAPNLRRSLLVLFGAVGMVLLIACVNLANLLLARSTVRRPEMAVRLAIGAGRARLIRMLVTESVVLACLGGLASLLVAFAGTRVLSAINPQEALRAQNLAGGIGAVGFENIRLDGSALLFTFLVTLVVGVVFGLVPAIRSTRSDLSRDLKTGSGAAGAGRREGISRRSLVVAEIALALVLLAGSGLMIRSLSNLTAINPGFNGDQVLTLRVTIPRGTIAPDSMAGLYTQLQEEIAALPSVTSVGLSDCSPLSGGCNGTIMTFADRPATATGNAMVGVHWVTPGWFQSMRVPVKRGRMFTAADRVGTDKVLVINEAAALKYFPGEDPIGKRVGVYQGGFHTGATIIGIVGDVRYGTIDDPAKPDAYISYAQSAISRMIVYVRTTGDPAAIAPTVREVVRRVAPRNPVYDIQPMSARMATANAQARFSATLLGLFAVVALVLAMMGIYGVMSFGVAQRTREIGIRVALGADRSRVLGLVLREGAVLALIGVSLGAAAAVTFTRLLRTMLYEVSTTDMPTYATVCVLLAAAVLLATWIPARRAANLNPVNALRA